MDGLLNSVWNFLTLAWPALAAGLLLQLTMTQWAKLYFPVSWRKPKRERVTRACAFLFGAIPTASILLLVEAPAVVLWASPVVGAAGPMIYDAVTSMAIAKWPALAGKLSGYEGAKRRADR